MPNISNEEYDRRAAEVAAALAHLSYIELERVSPNLIYVYIDND